MKHCKNCGQPIEYMETPIDNFWWHTHNDLMLCDEWQPGVYATPEEGFCQGATE